MTRPPRPAPDGAFARPPSSSSSSASSATATLTATRPQPRLNLWPRPGRPAGDGGPTRVDCGTCKAWGAAVVVVAGAAGWVAAMGNVVLTVVLAAIAGAAAVTCRGEHRPPAAPPEPEPEPVASSSSSPRPVAEQLQRDAIVHLPWRPDTPPALRPRVRRTGAGEPPRAPDPPPRPAGRHARP